MSNNISKIILLSLVGILLSACVSRPNFEQIRGNSQALHQAGITFSPPSNYLWNIMRQYTYETVLAVKNEESQETLLTVISIFNLPKLKSADDLLSFIKSNEEKSPKTNRFETIEESLTPYNYKNAKCVKKNFSKKDYGAKRNGKYTIFEVYGMYCIHPYKEDIGVNIELSRKAPFPNKNELFIGWGEELLQSVTFEPFRK